MAVIYWTPEQVKAMMEELKNSPPRPREPKVKEEEVSLYKDICEKMKAHWATQNPNTTNKTIQKNENEYIKDKQWLGISNRDNDKC